MRLPTNDTKEHEGKKFNSSETELARRLTTGLKKPVHRRAKKRKVALKAKAPGKIALIQKGRWTFANRPHTGTVRGTTFILG
jgi:hypothetical protein